MDILLSHTCFLILFFFFWWVRTLVECSLIYWVAAGTTLAYFSVLKPLFTSMVSNIIDSDLDDIMITEHFILPYLRANNKPLAYIEDTKRQVLSVPQQFQHDYFPPPEPPVAHFFTRLLPEISPFPDKFLKKWIYVAVLLDKKSGFCGQKNPNLKMDWDEIVCAVVARHFQVRLKNRF